MNAIAQRKDFALAALLTAVTLSYVGTAALWLSQLM